MVGWIIAGVAALVVIGNIIGGNDSSSRSSEDRNRNTNSSSSGNPGRKKRYNLPNAE